MFIELHIIQNFAPSNLNRGETGTPKDCEFGGHRRARISSQCLKRAIRRESGFSDLLEKHGGGVRTRRLIIEVAKGIDGQDQPTEKTIKIVSEVFKEGGIERPEIKKGKEEEEQEKDHTKLILFMDQVAIQVMIARFKESWAELSGKDKDAKTGIITELGKILAESVKSPDIAMFGRMVEIKGEKPFGKLNLNIDAAAQVAHAISTHKCGVEFDFYTAVDDLLPHGETGAGMMGTVEFNSACFYRYANVDLAQLKDNLGGDQVLVATTVEAFLRATINAVPSGKQNSTAAQNPPLFVLAVARKSGLWSLANAFVNPATTRDGDLVSNSIRKLDEHWGQLMTMYGGEQITDKCYVTFDGQDLVKLNGSRVSSVNELVARIVAAVKGA